MTDQKTNALELTVSQLSFSLKKVVEEQFGYVRVRGEIGRVSRPASGHIYLDLKDDKAVLNAVIWKGVASRLKHQPEEGLEVIASGKLTTFPGASRYQIVIDNIEPAGAGALMALLEERKKKLTAEGLFEEGRKQLLPYMPRVIGVVTSPTGSVVRDVLHRLKDRFPLHVLVWPVRVQGENCASEVSQAIAGFNSLEPGGELPRPDVIIVARGGGSIEDLWGFNEEAVVRAAADSDIPLISAVGHETDWTLLDLVADIRAPTPTAAAEMAVPVRADLEARIATLAARLQSGIKRTIDTPRNNLRAAERGLSTPQSLLDIPRQKFDNIAMRLGQGLTMVAGAKRTEYEKIAGRLSWRGLSQNINSGNERTKDFERRARQAIKQSLERYRVNIDIAKRLQTGLAVAASAKRTDYEKIAGRLSWHGLSQNVSNGFDKIRGFDQRSRRSIEQSLESCRSNLEQAKRMLDSLSYINVLERGFAVVADANGKTVTSALAVGPNSLIHLRMKDGEIAAKTLGSASAPKTSTPQGKKPAPSKQKSNQGDLF